MHSSMVRFIKLNKRGVAVEISTAAFLFKKVKKYGIITLKNIKCNQNLRRKFKLQLKFGSEKADATLK